MSKSCRIAVIVQRGRVVGTQQLPAPSRARRGPVAQLVAGPGQRLVELTIDAPGKFESADAIERFHESLLPLVRQARSTRSTRAPK